MDHPLTLKRKLAIAAKHGRAVGTIDKFCELLGQKLEIEGYTYVMLKAANTKKPKSFYESRGYKGGSNEHIRDAQSVVLNGIVYSKVKSLDQVNKSKK